MWSASLLCADTDWHPLAPLCRWPYAPWWQLHICKGITQRLEAEGKFVRQPPGVQRLLWE